MTEWQPNIYVQLIRTASGTALDTTNSALFSKGSYYYSRETDDGDFAGRVPIGKDEDLHVVMINYSETDDQSLYIQYGAAVQSAVVGVASLAATIATVFLF